MRQRMRAEQKIAAAHYHHLPTCLAVAPLITAAILLQISHNEGSVCVRVWVSVLCVSVTQFKVCDIINHTSQDSTWCVESVLFVTWWKLSACNTATTSWNKPKIFGWHKCYFPYKKITESTYTNLSFLEDFISIVPIVLTRRGNQVGKLCLINRDFNSRNMSCVR